MAASISMIKTGPTHTGSENESAEARDLGPFWSALDRYRLLGSLHTIYLAFNPGAGRAFLSERKFTNPKDIVHLQLRKIGN
jgi:hypothetical protein